PKSDLLRVDILNTIGLSMMLMGTLCWMVLSLVDLISKPGAPPLSRRSLAGQGGDFDSNPRSAQSTRRETPKRQLLVTAAISTALLISLLTPLLWTTWRPRFLPWPLESYINGVHNLGAPQPWLFPIFPWAAFAFIGLAAGFILQSPWTRTREVRVFLSLGVVGVVLIVLSRWLDA